MKKKDVIRMMIINFIDGFRLLYGLDGGFGVWVWFGLERRRSSRRIEVGVVGLRLWLRI